jgi:prophage antirepressor-like protein
MSDKHNALVPFTSQFSGQDVTTIFYAGRPCWIAKDIGRVLGYGNDGQKLTQRVTQDWAHEFVEGLNFEVIRGKELVQFKKLLKVIPDSGITFAPHVLVLFESGINMVCMKMS